MKPLVDQRPLGQVFGIKLVILAVLLHQIGIDGMTVPDDGPIVVERRYCVLGVQLEAPLLNRRETKQAHLP
jgi:hypothetical protein